MRTAMLSCVLATAALLLVSPAASAESISITLTGCTTCQGSSFTLTATPTGTPGQYTVTLTVDTSTFSGSAQATQITSVEFKIVDGDNHGTAVLTLAPGGAGNWTTMGGPLASTGCEGGNLGFVCSNANSNGLAPLGGTLTWTWTVNLPPGTPLSLEIHIGAKYNNAAGDKKGWLVSESVVIPEPGTMALFGLGLAGIGGAIRRRTRRKQQAGA